jgi:8-amino-7-oxononanoate synthase
MNIDNFLQTRLIQQQQRDLYRQRQIYPNNYLDFCSNDYLGLADHREIKQAAQLAIDNFGVGARASQLVNGHNAAHAELEQQFAEFIGCERALLFSSGYLANLGVLTGILQAVDMIFLDKLSHASLIDAAKLSPANFKRYPHRNIMRLQNLLANSPARIKLIVTDGVFSMDGDIADLPQLIALGQAEQAYLMLDDAHGIGVLGAGGRGSLQHFGLNPEHITIIISTLGKAFGVAGALVGGSKILIESLIQFARSYIYTTAPPAALAVAASKGLELMQTEAWRREKLQANIAYFRHQAQQYGIKINDSITPIQPIIVGDNDLAMRISAGLYERGIAVTAIRPPTVAVNTARLRITLSARHELQHIDKLIYSLRELIPTPLSIAKGN